MNSNKKIANSFSKHLFWDIDIEKIDFNKNSKFVISKVLQYGLYPDWKLLVKLYGLKHIADTAKTIKELDKKTASFLCAITNTSKTDYQCYSTNQSVAQHWNF